VVESAPRPAFEMVEADLALELLVVAFDSPPELYDSGELVLGRRCRQVADVELVLVVAGSVLADQPHLLRRGPSFGAPLGEVDTRKREEAGLHTSLAVGT